MTNEDKGEPRDFVYLGQRYNGKERMVKLMLVGPEDTLKEARLYKYSSKMDRSLGHVYFGASFTEGTAYGVPTAKWQRKWPISMDIIQWEGEQLRDLTAMKRDKAEKEESKVSELERAMLPLRREMARLQARFDLAGMQAFKEHVIATLYIKPRSDE